MATNSSTMPPRNNSAFRFSRCSSAERSCGAAASRSGAGSAWAVPK